MKPADASFDISVRGKEEAPDASFDITRKGSDSNEDDQSFDISVRAPADAEKSFDISVRNVDDHSFDISMRKSKRDSTFHAGVKDKRLQPDKSFDLSEIRPALVA